jgi:uncharacterized membrane protein YphA (DoxX/SURF4 family)
MSLLRRLARPSLAASFVSEGLTTLFNPSSREKNADGLVRVAGKLGLPDDRALVVRVHAGVQVGAGVLLAVGKWRRLSAVFLLATTAADVYADQCFWTEEDPEARERQRTGFLRSLGLAGGLLLELVGPGEGPSLGRWARAVGTNVAAGTVAGERAVGEAARYVVSDVAPAVGQAARQVVGEVGPAVGEAARYLVSDVAPAVGQAARQVVGEVGPAVEEAARYVVGEVAPLVGQAVERASALVATGPERAGDVVAALGGRSASLAHAAHHLAGQLPFAAG